MNVKVLAKTYEIVEVDQIEFGASLLGQIDHIEDLIKIYKNMSFQNKKVTLLHEILHSIFEQLGLDEEHDNEQLIKTISTVIVQILESNDDLLSFFGLRQCTTSNGL